MPDGVRCALLHGFVPLHTPMRLCMPVIVSFEPKLHCPTDDDMALTASLLHMHMMRSSNTLQAVFTANLHEVLDGIWLLASFQLAIVCCRCMFAHTVGSWDTIMPNWALHAVRAPSHLNTWPR